MQTLLIVEDEKLIRKGIAAMASRSSVHIDEIIECRNGEEAMEILKSRKIDTVFMDIRMPKMDGLELARQMETLDEKPDVVVISGYDDFNYAVEMLKHGVFDYVLKPVKRETIEELLVNLEKKQQKNITKAKKEIQLLYHQIKFMTASNMSEQDRDNAQKQYRDIYGDESYVIICAPSGEGNKEDNFQGVFLENIRGQNLFLLPVRFLEEWCRQTNIRCFGVSKAQEYFYQCSQACREAREARVDAFMKCRTMVRAEECTVYEPSEGEIKEMEQFVEQFVRQISTKNRDTALKRFESMYFEARHGHRSPWDVLKMTENIQKMMSDVYQTLIPEDKKDLLKYDPPFNYENAESFMREFKNWIGQIVGCLSDEFVSDQNKRKIREAVDYIHENFYKDLNMALVSNYVSMNYSLFSLAFKEYTGVNFVNYLKNIRIKEAKRLLAETDLKITDISHKVGYENDKHFMKIFKNICGVSPSDYRKNQVTVHSGNTRQGG